MEVTLHIPVRWLGLPARNLELEREALSGSEMSLVRDVDTNEGMACKTTDPSCGKKISSEIVREFHMMVGLKDAHKHFIVQFKHWEVTDGCLFLYFLRYKGTVLDLYKDHAGEYSCVDCVIAYPKWFKWFLQQMNDALAFLEDHHVFHGEIKPANIYYLEGGRRHRFVVAGFGMAMFLKPEPHLAEFTYRGCRGYIAPEVVANADKPAVRFTSKADHFSFGLVLLAVMGVLCKKCPDLECRSWRTKLQSFEVEGADRFRDLAPAHHASERSAWNMAFNYRVESIRKAPDIPESVRDLLHEKASRRSMHNVVQELAPAREK